MAEIKHFQERLTSEKLRISRLLGWVKTEATEEDDSFSESAPASGDSEYADHATDLYVKELDVAMEERFKDRIREIDGALQRIATHQYGTCIRCGKPIPESRLEALPETPFCLEDAMQEEVEG